MVKLEQLKIGKDVDVDMVEKESEYSYDAVL